MPSTCCVPGCKKRPSEMKESVSVFKIPADKIRRKLWLNKIGCGEYIDASSYTLYVCEKHFTTSDFQLDSRDSNVSRNIPNAAKLLQRKRLKKTAVPTMSKNNSVNDAFISIGELKEKMFVGQSVGHFYPPLQQTVYLVLYYPLLC